MKNQILTCKDHATGLYAALLFSYEETPGGSLRPILRVASRFVFDSSEGAAGHLFDSLKPEVRENTEIVAPPEVEA